MVGVFLHELISPLQYLILSLQNFLGLGQAPGLACILAACLGFRERQAGAAGGQEGLTKLWAAKLASEQVGKTGGWKGNCALERTWGTGRDNKPGHGTTI